MQFFLESWQGVSDLEIQYARSDSWEKFRASGGALLTKFVEEELPRISDVEASERPFTLDVTSLDTPFVGRTENSQRHVRNVVENLFTIGGHVGRGEVRL